MAKYRDEDSANGNVDRQSLLTYGWRGYKSWNNFICSVIQLLWNILFSHFSCTSCYPAIHSISGILSLLCLCHFCMYGYGFLSPGFTDRREILHGGLATSRTGFPLFSGDSPRDGRVLGVNRGHMAGYASCWSWSTCLFVFLLFWCVLTLFYINCLLDQMLQVNNNICVEIVGIRVYLLWGKDFGDGVGMGASAGYGLGIGGESLPHAALSLLYWDFALLRLAYEIYKNLYVSKIIHYSYLHFTVTENCCCVIFKHFCDML